MAGTTARKRSTAPSHAGVKKSSTTIQDVLRVLRNGGGGKPLRVADIIEKTGRPAPTVYSTVYGEAKKDGARIRQVGKGEFALTAAGRKKARA